MEQDGLQGESHPDGQAYSGHWLRSLGTAAPVDTEAHPAGVEVDSSGRRSIPATAAAGSSAAASSSRSRSDSQPNPFDVPAGYRTTLTTDRTAGHGSMAGAPSGRQRHHSGPQELVVKMPRRTKRSSPGSLVRLLLVSGTWHLKRTHANFCSRLSIPTTTLDSYHIFPLRPYRTLHKGRSNREFLPCGDTSGRTRKRPVTR